MDSFEEVEQWVREHDRDGDGVSGLRKAMSVGLISGNSAKVAHAWLDELENGARRRLEAEQLELARRSTEAAEVSAAASASSAKYAADSARWAKWALLLAAASLIVSAWPHINDIAR